MIVTVEDLQRTAQHVSETALSLVSRINKAQSNVESSIRLNIGDPPMLESRRLEWNRAASQIRRAVLKDSDGERWDALRAMTEGEQAALAAESQFASPSMILARAGLGSEVRSRYLEQIASAGPLELRNFSEHAKRTGDRVLGAAIMTRLDSLKKAERDLAGVSRAKLAESLCGEDFRAAQKAIRTIKVTLRESLARNRSFENGKPVNARDAVGIALMRQEANA